MLEAADLAYMRESIAELLPDTCNILSVTETADGQGGISQTWGTASASVSCRIDVIRDPRMDELRAGASVRNFQATFLSLPYSATVTVSNRVEHGGLTYNVVSTNTDQSWIAVKRVELERIE